MRCSAYGVVQDVPCQWFREELLGLEGSGVICVENERKRRGEIETAHTSLPWCGEPLVIFFGLDHGHFEHVPFWNQYATGSEESLPCIFDRRNGGATERKRTSNVRHNDVHALRQFCLARITLEELYAIRETVLGRKLPRGMNTVIQLDGENTPRSRTAG